MNKNFLEHYIEILSKGKMNETLKIVTLNVIVPHQIS